MADIKVRIAKRVAKELKDGDVVNLGIGLPTMVSDYLPEGVTVTLHSENGFTGLDAAAEEGKEDVDIINSGGAYVTAVPWVNYFDTATSFGIIRGGHVDARLPKTETLPTGLSLARRLPEWAEQWTWYPEQRK